ncbi:MAG: restriction endonuclease [Nibricoccus sp.]
MKAIINVLKQAEKPLTTEEIFRTIVERNLYVFGAENPKGIVNGKLRKHSENLNFPSANLTKHFYCYESDSRGKSRYVLLKNRPTSVAAVGSSTSVAKSTASADATPEELLQSSHMAHLKQMEQELLETVKKCHSRYFVQVTIDLFTKMGYGGFPEGAKVTDGPNDKGIDGYICEDPFGFDKVKIQAKCYSDKTVDPRDVDAFAGSKHDDEKGIFITTSRFTAATREKFVDGRKRIKLIDGAELVQLLIKHEIGVRRVRSLPVFAVVQEYFQAGPDSVE